MLSEDIISLSKAKHSPTVSGKYIRQLQIDGQQEACSGLASPPGLGLCPIFLTSAGKEKEACVGWERLEAAIRHKGPIDNSRLLSHPDEIGHLQVKKGGQERWRGDTHWAVGLESPVEISVSGALFTGPMETSPWFCCVCHAQLSPLWFWLLICRSCWGWKRDLASSIPPHHGAW